MLGVGLAEAQKSGGMNPCNNNPYIFNSLMGVS